MIHLHFIPWTLQVTQRPPEVSLLLYEINVAPLNCGDILPPANQEPLLCSITPERPQTPRVTAPDGPQKWLPNHLCVPFPLSLAGKLTLMAAARRIKPEGWADGHRCPFPPSSEQPSQEHEDLRSVVEEEEWNPEGSKGSIPTLCRGAGELLPTRWKFRPCSVFIQPAARAFLQGTTVQRFVVITSAPRCLNQPVQRWTRKLSLFCPLKILSQLKAGSGGRSACKSKSRGGCAYSHFTT